MRKSRKSSNANLRDKLLNLIVFFGKNRKRRSVTLHVGTANTKQYKNFKKFLAVPTWRVTDRYHISA